MKRNFLVFGLTILVALFASKESVAQKDLFGGYGWQFGGKARFIEGDIDIKSDWAWHVGADIATPANVSLRLHYNQVSGTEAFWRPLPGYSNLFPAEQFLVDVHYLQIGAIKGSQMGQLEPYGIITLGASWINAEQNNGNEIGSVTRFAITLGGGVKYFMSDRVGIKFEARMLMPMYFAGVGLWAGTGGAGVSVNSAVPILQGDLTGGLVLRLAGGE